MQAAVQESFSERVLRDMSSAVLVLNRGGFIKYINRPAAEMFELDPDLEPGTQRFSLTQEDSYNDEFYECILNALYNKDETNVDVVKYRSPSGRRYVVKMSSSFLDSPDDSKDEIVVTLSDVTRSAELQQKISDSSKTFTIFLFGFSAWMLIYALWEFLKRPIAADYMTHGVEILSLIMLVFIILRTSLTWRDLGVMHLNLKKTVRTALIISACAVAFLFAVKFVARLMNPNVFEPQAPFFDISRFGLRQILYVLTAGIQEFLARSVMQANLKRIIVSKHSGAISIILSSLIFAALHIHFGFFFMVGAAVLAGLEGILYDRQQNIVGVWIVHWVFGVSGTLLCLIDH